MESEDGQSEESFLAYLNEQGEGNELGIEGVLGEEEIEFELESFLI